MLLTLTCALATVPVDTIINSDSSVRYVVPIRVGANPGKPMLAELRPSESHGSVPKLPPHVSMFATDTSDVVYIGNKLERIPVQAGVNAAVVGKRELATLSNTWAFCNDRLYFSTTLPRHCKRGGLLGACTPKTDCPFVYNTVQHAGPCNRTMPIVGSDNTIFIDCTRTDSFGSYNMPVAISSPSLAVSLVQSKAAWEYNHLEGTLTVYKDPTPASASTNVVAMLAIIVMLSVWQSWTINLSQAVRTSDKILLSKAAPGTENAKLVSKVHDVMAWYGMLIADMLFFGSWIQIDGIINNARAYHPEALDLVLEYDTWIDEATVDAYVKGFVGAVQGLAVSVVVITLYLMFCNERSIYFKIQLFKDFAQRLKGATNNVPNVVFLRWAVETQAILALHVLMPEQLGHKFHAAMSMGLGGVLAVITGRDLTAIVDWLKPYKKPWATAPRAFVIAALVTMLGLLILTHVTLFMLLEMFSLAATAYSPLPLLISAMLTLQSAAAGAIWYLSKPLVIAHGHSA